VLFATNHKNPSLAFRFTAVLAVLLVAVLSIFAASPTLHAWLHDHEKQVTQSALTSADTSTVPTHAVPAKASDDHDDGCAIALFAAGVLAIVGLLLSWLFERRVSAVVVWPILQVVERDLREWLPPLCGPPAS
jgi:hypothetical protein